MKRRRGGSGHPFFIEDFLPIGKMPDAFIRTWEKIMIKKALISCAVAAMLAAPTAFAGGIVVDNDDAGKLTLSSKFFINGTQKKTTINGVNTARTTGLALDRAYISIGYKVNDIWSMKLTTDATLNTAATGKKTEVFIKNAYIKAAFAPEAVFTIGVIGTPWIGYENGLDGHRYIVKAYTDTHGLDSSADAGVGLAGKFADGVVGYALTIVNGKGDGDIAATDAVDFNSRLGIYPVEGLTIDLQYRSGYKGTKTLGAAGTKSTLTQAMLTYAATDNYRVGVNYISDKSTTAANLETKTTGIAAWTRAKFNDSFGVYGRYENTKVDPNNTTINSKENRFVVAAEYFANKNIRLSLAWDQSKVTDYLNVTGDTRKDSRIGLFTQAAF
jgi:hypothetical protein